MRACVSMTSILAMTLSAALALPTPDTPEHASLLAAWGTYCANAPTVPVGTLLDPNLIVPITQFAKLPTLGLNIYWCAPSSRTYISVRYYGSFLPANWNSIQDRLKGAFDRTQAKIKAGGDRIILGGFFFWGDDPDNKGIYIFTQNIDNHQQTYGVLGAAITALQDLIRTLDGLRVLPRPLAFVINDGNNAVGRGNLASARVLR